ncbi:MULTISPECIES: low temperature requirement protein A [Cryobacterium]|uniref:low temperature requirement protein A n=1 Tax=Cryobacterium sp. TmT3-12 TaxID=1259266 RepID=UPI001F540275|nr:MULTISPECIES: low temperature requirement protein A [Cryobacterium]
MVNPDGTEASNKFPADPVELFFDLAFVFAFSQLVKLLLGGADLGHRRSGNATVPDAVAAMDPIHVVGQRCPQAIENRPRAVPDRDRCQCPDGGGAPERLR